jgi:hypothetical protein
MVDMGQYDAVKRVHGDSDNGVFDRHRQRVERVTLGFKLIGHAERLREIEAERVSGKLKAVPAGRAREKELCESVATVAKYFGVILKPIYAIDSNGELPIVSQGVHISDLVGKPFSREFCDALTTHTKPRCGMPGTVAVMNPEHSNWCRINHFEAERMILAIADQVG